MVKLLHWAGAVLLILALLGIVTLLFFDILNRLEFTVVHRHAGAWSFMLIGTSYLSLLFSSRRTIKLMWKEIALGFAFFLWGCESFLPAGPLATVVDTAVIVIFVTDLSLLVVERLKHQPYKKLRQK